jgi:hypothetical protein
MAASSSATSAPTNLRLGERVISRCDDGLLGAEYALFDAGDVVLRATDPVAVREVGYMTTAGDALERLARAKVTPELAIESANALRPAVAASFARGSAARSLVKGLGAHELFDGAVFLAAELRYEGIWLDLRALSSALAVPWAATALQVLHLVAALSEVPGCTPLHLATARAARGRRPGERTHHRIELDGVRRLPERLRALLPSSKPVTAEPTRDELLRVSLLARVRERAAMDLTPAQKDHLSTLEGALTAKTTPNGPLADPVLRAVERRLAAGHVEGVASELERIEALQGRGPGTRYLRARSALVEGHEPPWRIALELSQLSDEQSGFHEATLVAARTWLAAGEHAHARYFARRLFDDPCAGESERLIALEILEATMPTGGSNVPPAVAAAWTVPHLPAARVPAFPSLAKLPPPQTVPPPTAPPPPPGPPLTPRMPWPSASPPAVQPPRAEAVLESRVPEPAPPQPRAVPPRNYAPELVETLALPFGLSESTLSPNDLPTTPLHARIALTRISRDLGRDYRLGYGKTLRCNVIAVDAMQQHLARRFAGVTGASISDPGVAWELRRHGALLSEIIARALGGEWIDVGPGEPGYWTMLVSPATRTCPIGRVYRFVALGQDGERDLVSYYLNIETRVREERG